MLAGPHLHLADVACGDGHGLLAEDVGTLLERFEHDVAMRRGWRRNDDSIQPFGREHRPVIRVRGAAVSLRGRRDDRGLVVTHRDEIEPVDASEVGKVGLRDPARADDPEAKGLVHLTPPIRGRRARPG